jgi:hypothetical protein
MKIGLSYSRCVRDIVEGEVDINDVLIIVSRTDFDPTDDKQWEGIYTGYSAGSFYNMNAEWANSEFTEEDFRRVTLELWYQGKLHQPRKFGARPARRGEYWLEAVLPDSELDRNPAARDAWDRFQTIAGLTSIKLNRDYR